MRAFYAGLDGESYIACCLYYTSELQEYPDVQRETARGTPQQLVPVQAQYMSAARTARGEHLGVLLDEEARLVASVPLSARAHGAAAHRATGQAVFFSRRPGRTLCAFNIENPNVSTSVEASAGRHFYGHGVYAQSGDLLYATENDFDNARGVLGVYDVTRHYTRIGEIATGGIGPHDVVSIPGTDLLVVANGGIRTHPDTGREKLNIDTMQASITLLNSRSGAILGMHVLSDDLHQLSLRHLAYAGDGKVWFAAQYQGTDVRVEGLLGYLSIDQTMASFHGGISKRGFKLLALPDALQARTQYYLSSVASAGDVIVFTSSRGGVSFAIDRKTYQLQQWYRFWIVVEWRVLIHHVLAVPQVSAQKHFPW